jgi:hypothetical protein
MRVVSIRGGIAIVNMRGEVVVDCRLGKDLLFL